MLNQVNLEFKTPTNLEELKAHVKDFEFLQHFMPKSYPREQLLSVLNQCVGYHTFVYGNNVLLGSFQLDIYKHSVELHGIARPDMSTVIQHPRILLNRVYQIILDEVFDTLNKDKVIIKAPLDNKGVIGFARMNGFKRIPNTDNGQLIWKLTRLDYKRKQQNESR